jgi:polar amino acid transport system substrate-binding protein
MLFTGCSKKDTQPVLKVGIDLKYPPFMYLDEKGTPTGLEPDLARAFAEYLGMKVEIVNTDFSMLIPALETGEVSIVISDMSITEERKQKVDFSQGYRFGRTTALVNKEFYDQHHISDDMDPDTFFHLEGIKAIGLSGTVGTIIPQQYGIEATEATEIGTAILEVTTGNSNVLVGSYVVFGDHNANRDTTELYLGIPNYVASAFAVKKGNNELIERANAFIATLYEKGGLYEQLATKYDKSISEVFFDDSIGLDYIVAKPQ